MTVDTENLIAKVIDDADDIADPLDGLVETLPPFRPLYSPFPCFDKLSFSFNILR